MECVVAYLGGAEIGSVAQVVVAGVGDAERIVGYRAGRAASVIELAGMTVSDMSSESCWMRLSATGRRKRL